MKIIPAIDLKDGQVVRLTKGKYETVKVYSSDPAQIAGKWYAEGAEMLHIVDLDGALKGEPKNLKAVSMILKAVDIPVQFGGGLRTMDAIDSAIDLGVAKVILGSKAVGDIDFIKECVNRHKEKIIVSVDSKDGIVMLEGWTESSGIEAVKLANDLKDAGVASLIYTDVLVDGTLSGPNFKSISKFLDNVELPIITAGGISRADDIRKLSSLGKKNLSGVIIGKALYEGAIDLKEAMSICLRRE